MKLGWFPSGRMNRMIPEGLDVPKIEDEKAGKTAGKI